MALNIFNIHEKIGLKHEVELFGQTSVKYCKLDLQPVKLFFCVQSCPGMLWNKLNTCLDFAFAPIFENENKTSCFGVGHCSFFQLALTQQLLEPVWGELNNVEKVHLAHEIDSNLMLV